MKVNMLSGEAGKLTAVLRDLRCKIQDKEKEGKDILRRKNDTMAEIADMQERKSKLSLEIKDKSKELAGITEKAKAEIREILANLSNLKSAERNNLKAIEELNKKRDEYDKYRLSREKTILYKTSQLSIDRSVIEKRDKTVTDKETTNVLDTKKLHDDEKEIQTLKDNLHKQQNDAEANIKKSREILEKTIKREETTKQAVKDGEEKDAQLLKLEKALNEERERNEVEEKRLMDEKDEHEASKAGNIKRSLYLDAREKDIIIKELRVKKIVRDKNIADELKKLEDELNK